MDFHSQAPELRPAERSRPWVPEQVVTVEGVQAPGVQMVAGDPVVPLPPVTGVPPEAVPALPGFRSPELETPVPSMTALPAGLDAPVPGFAPLVVDTTLPPTRAFESDPRAGLLLSQGLEPGSVPAPAAAQAGQGGVVKGLEIDPRKFDYLFGRVSSNAHNAARSNQLALEMKRLGVSDTAAGRQMLTEHLALSARAEGNVARTFSNQYGNFEVRESLFMGPSGKAAKFESTFQGLEDGTRRFSTVIPLH